MTGREFYDRIMADDRFEWLGTIEADKLGPDRVRVKLKTAIVEQQIAVTSVLNTLWEDLEAFLLFKRDAIILDLKTRIVGYYSTVLNWNGSKVEELKARRRGFYGVEPSAVARGFNDAVLPQEVVDMVAAGRSGEMVCDITPKSAVA